MTAQDLTQWPAAQLDPLRRLHVMAEGIPGLVISERIIPVPFDTLWRIASDLEHTLNSLSGNYVTSFEYSAIDGERREAMVRGRFGIRDRFRIVLQPGWCWMDGRVLCAAMAAVQAPEGTRFAWAAGLRVPGGRFARPLTKPVLDRTLRRLEDVARDRMDTR